MTTRPSLSAPFLQGQTALITGAGGGIGEATARAFAAAGAAVALVDRDAAAVAAAARRLEAQGSTVSHWAADVTDESAVQRVVTAVVERHGRLGHTVLCAGILYNGEVVQTSLDDWRRTLEINLTGSFLVARDVARAMIARGDHGTITFLSSLAGKRGAAYGAAYCASKFGVLGLMESLAREVTARGIRVNAVCPGDVETAMIAQNVREMAAARAVSEHDYRRQVVGAIPMGRLADPEEVAAVCVFLASPAASYISGASINVDGGVLGG